MNKFFNIVFGRILYTAFFVILQASAIVIMYLYFNEKFAYFYAFSIFISIAVLLHLVYKDGNPEYKLAWVIPILVFPLFGGFLYICFSRNRTNDKIQKSLKELDKYYKESVNADEIGLEKLEKEDYTAYLQSKYIYNTAHTAPELKTKIKYLPIGEEFYKSVTEELKKAKKFIFMEYFIIEEGYMWDNILEILKQKIAEGVEIRLIYDDFGCMFKLPQNYNKKLEALGIKTIVFHRFNNILTPSFNNRDHRKILVIDGMVSFTGGINLADEYMNKTSPYGHWKDTAVKLTGAATWDFTVMFLSLWNTLKNTTEDFSKYEPDVLTASQIENDGYVQPFSDIPLDDYDISKNVYMNIINKAEKYVYITTPYLIIDNAMTEALCNAATSGVDVRIITPKIGDHKYIHFLSRSYYDTLIKYGVKIYEYTPGFIHAKNLVCDDKYAIVGTVNLDFRSLYLHYECAVWMYGSSAVADIKEDYDKTLKMSEQIKKPKKRRLLARVFISILKAFAPLM
ncbi:MAG: cardiolipin synthase [Acutalibacteraceae bacterium]